MGRKGADGLGERGGGFSPQEGSLRRREGKKEEEKEKRWMCIFLQTLNSPRACFLPASPIHIHIHICINININIQR